MSPRDTKALREAASPTQLPRLPHATKLFGHDKLFRRGWPFANDNTLGSVIDR